MVGKAVPGWECVKIQIFDPGGLHENAEPRPEGWEATEPQAYVILRRGVCESSHMTDKIILFCA